MRIVYLENGKRISKCGDRANRLSESNYKVEIKTEKASNIIKTQRTLKKNDVNLENKNGDSLPPENK